MPAAAASPANAPTSSRDAIAGALFGPWDCDRCRDTGVISNGYHGPPGDDRGYGVCSCREPSFSAEEFAAGYRGLTWQRAYELANPLRSVPDIG